MHFYIFFAVFALKLKENLPAVRRSEANGEVTIIEIGIFLFVILYTLINNEVPSWYALLGGVAGSVGAKVRLFSETTILFEWNCCF